MKVTRARLAIYAVIAVILLGGIVSYVLGVWRTGKQVVRFGITPYQDTALPVVGLAKGWYAEEGVDVQVVPLTWGDVVTALTSGSVDVVLYNFNSFMPPYNNAATSGSKPVYYCPLYVFKGQAVMVKGDSGLKVFRDREFKTAEERQESLKSVCEQLRGKKIAVTKGTELEEIVLTALKVGGVKRDEAEIIHASAEDCLSGFLAGSVDAFAAGLTERVEARRQGATEFLTTADVMKPVIDGLVTSEAFAKSHEVTLTKLLGVWFRIVKYVGADPKQNSKEIREYLVKQASTRYTADEYAIAWTFQTFAPDAGNARRMFSDTSSPYYWQESWARINRFLLDEGKIDSPVPEEAYWGGRILQSYRD